MKSKMQMLTRILCAAVLLVNGLPAFAQSAGTFNKRVAAPPQDRVAVTQAGQADVLSWKVADGNTFQFIAAEGAFGGKVVKGAPYSAQAITEDVRVLSDGNRIVRKNTSSIYRDSEGRTRQEHTLRAIGPYAAAGDPPQTVSIFDPVEGAHYSLDVNSKTARKVGILRLDNVDHVKGAEGVTIYRAIEDEPAVIATGKGQAQLRKRTTEAEVAEKEAVAIAHERMAHEKMAAVAAAQADHHAVILSPSIAGGRVEAYKTPAPENLKTESLGTQNIEGVTAEGTRTTFTIPAGDIGNELPINIVTETWFSPELQVVVMRKHSDPQRGETTYRLTNINRSEPARSLFEVPADYTMKETIEPMRKKMVETEMERAKKIKEKGQQL